MSALGWALIGIYLIGALVAAVGAWALWDRWLERQSDTGGHPGAHAAARRSFRVRLPYMEPGSYASVPEPRLEIHKDVLAAAWDRPWLVDEIRIERTKNLPGLAVGSAETSDSAESRSGRSTVSLLEAGEPHHRDWTPRPLSPVRDGVAPWVAEALRNASGEDTVVRNTWPKWLLGIRTCTIGDLDLAVRAATTDLQMWGRKIGQEVQPSWPAS